FPSTFSWSFAGSIRRLKSLTILPLTLTRPASISSSACLREHNPVAATARLRRSLEVSSRGLPCDTTDGGAHLARCRRFHVIDEHLCALSRHLLQFACNLIFGALHAGGRFFHNFFGSALETGNGLLGRFFQMPELIACLLVQIFG